MLQPRSLIHDRRCSSSQHVVLPHTPYQIQPVSCHQSATAPEHSASANQVQRSSIAMVLLTFTTSPFKHIKLHTQAHNPIQHPLHPWQLAQRHTH